VVTVDLHCDQIQGFFHNTPVVNLYALPEFVAYFKRVHADALGEGAKPECVLLTCPYHAFELVPAQFPDSRCGCTRSVSATAAMPMDAIDGEAVETSQRDKGTFYNCLRR